MYSFLSRSGYGLYLVTTPPRGVPPLRLMQPCFRKPASGNVLWALGERTDGVLGGRRPVRVDLHPEKLRNGVLRLWTPSLFLLFLYGLRV